jgi:hypothetical protein
MLRITTWRINGNPRADVTPQAGIQAFQQMCSELERIPGAGKVRFFLGNGGVVTVGEPQSYAVADTILQSKAAQAAVGKVLSLGYGIVEDHFLLEPAQVIPFTEAATAVPAGLSRN